MSRAGQGANKAIAQERRRLLIDATITAISQYGLGNLTLARIAKIAGLTAGSVNFHFESKEMLLLHTLSHLVEELEQSLDGALQAAGDDPAALLTAIFETHLNPEITESRKMAVWYAFSSESRARDDYQRICGDQERRIFAIILKLCGDIIHRGNQQQNMNTRAMANAIQGLIDEVWQEIFSTGDSYDRADARYIYLSFLASVFPWCFTMPREADSGKKRLQRKDKSLRIVRAGASELAEVSALFDLYRQFYRQDANPKLARRFIGTNIREQRSVIFLATDGGDGKALGFTQLYPGLCSVAARPFLTLYDLYVCAEARHRGVGRELLNEAKKYAKKVRACRIDLETAVDNYAAQRLYEDEGYERDVAFYKYSLDIGGQ